jgi:hypothetical protein
MQEMMIEWCTKVNKAKWTMSGDPKETTVEEPPMVEGV